MGKGKYAQVLLEMTNNTDCKKKSKQNGIPTSPYLLTGEINKFFVENQPK